jgi:membrane-associated phospholipid phosphatase
MLDPERKKAHPCAWPRGFFVDVFSTGMLAIAVLVIDTVVKPRQLVFSPTDPDISYPYEKHESVPNGLLYATCLVGPLIAMLLFELIIPLDNKTGRERVVRFLFQYWVLIQALVVTNFWTEIIKVVYGSLRPDFLARCLPDSSGKCTNTNISFVNDGRKSWPSGHSSNAFCAMGYISLFAIFQLELITLYKHPRSVPRAPEAEEAIPSVPVGTDRRASNVPMTGFILVFLPLFVALMIGISRITNYRHQAWDVIGGGIIGLLTVVCLFYLHFYQKYGQGTLLEERYAQKNRSPA